MKKFSIGQKVKYIGAKVMYSPPRGTVGTVKRVGAVGLDYQVAFPSDVNGVALWYHYDELEPMDKSYCIATASMRNEVLYAC